MNDRTKGFIFKTLLKGNREEIYKYYITYAKHNDYVIENMSSFYNLKDKRNGKHFILRHDVDLRGVATRRMYEMEKELGVTSTYYFRFSTIDRELINEMIDSGFEVGFHFETISDFVKQNRITNKNQLDYNQLRKQLSIDIKRFEAIIGSVKSSLQFGIEKGHWEFHTV